MKLRSASLSLLRLCATLCAMLGLATAEFPPDVYPRQFEEDAYQAFRRHRQAWSDEQCREFAYFLRNIIERERFQFQKDHVDFIDRRVQDGWWIVPESATRGDNDAFELEKESWRRRIVDVAVPKWQLTQADKEKIVSQYMSVLNLTLAAFDVFIPGIPQDYRQRVRDGYRKTFLINVNDPFSFILVWPLTDDQMNWVFEQANAKYEEAKLALLRRDRSEVDKAIAEWNSAVESGDEKRIRDAFENLASKVRWYMREYAPEKMLSLYYGPTIPRKSAAAQALAKKLSEKFMIESLEQLAREAASEEERMRLESEAERLRRQLEAEEDAREDSGSAGAPKESQDSSGQLAPQEPEPASSVERPTASAAGERKQATRQPQPGWSFSWQFALVVGLGCALAAACIRLVVRRRRRA